MLTCQSYITNPTKKRPDLSASSRSTLMAAFRKVLKIAGDEGVIDHVPAAPRVKIKDNPRPFFRFASLVSKEAMPIKNYY
jgi:hypothetical protein